LSPVLGSVPFEDPVVLVVTVVVGDSRAGAVGVICETVDVLPPTNTVVDGAAPATAAAGITRTALIQAMAAANLTEFTSGEL
jgi:hypothetical protein